MGINNSSKAVYVRFNLNGAGQKNQDKEVVWSGGARPWREIERCVLGEAYVAEAVLMLKLIAGRTVCTGMHCTAGARLTLTRRLSWGAVCDLKSGLKSGHLSPV